MNVLFQALARMYTGMILDNAINRGIKLLSPAQLQKKIEEGSDLNIIDTRFEGEFSDSISYGIPITP